MNTKLFSWVLAGLATGAAVWYLVSTEKGKEICDTFVDSAKDFGDSLKDKVKSSVKDASDYASSYADNLTSKAKDVADQAHKYANQATS